MKYVVDVRKDKVPYFMEFVKNHKYIKVEPVDSVKEKKGAVIKSEKEQLIEDLKQAAKEMKLFKEGKLKLRKIEDVLNEL